MRSGFLRLTKYNIQNRNEKLAYHSIKVGVITEARSSISRDFLIIKVLPEYELDHNKWFVIC